MAQPEIETNLINVDDDQLKKYIDKLKFLMDCQNMFKNCEHVQIRLIKSDFLGRMKQKDKFMKFIFD